MKLTEIKTPAIAGVVRERTVKDAIASIQNYKLKGAAMVDLHLSTLEDKYRNVDSIRMIVESTDLPILALNYSQNYDYSPINGVTEEERINLLKIAAQAGVAGIDIQGYTFDFPSKTNFFGDKSLMFYKDGIRELVTDEAIIQKQTDLIEEFHTMGCEVLLSIHPGVVLNSDQVVELAKFVSKRKPDIIKIVTTSECEEDNVEALKAMLRLKKELSCKVSYHLAGKSGHISRIINPIMGGFMMFCVDGAGPNNLPEQLQITTATDIVNNLKKVL